MIVWRGREFTEEQQVANACDDFVDLTPVSEVPAEATRLKWAALLPGGDVPLFNERLYDDGNEEVC